MERGGEVELKGWGGAGGEGGGGGWAGRGWASAGRGEGGVGAGGEGGGGGRWAEEQGGEGGESGGGRFELWEGEALFVLLLPSTRVDAVGVEGSPHRERGGVDGGEEAVRMVGHICASAAVAHSTGRL